MAFELAEKMKGGKVKIRDERLKGWKEKMGDNVRRREGYGREEKDCS